jgi:hypothetical protein
MRKGRVPTIGKNDRAFSKDWKIYGCRYGLFPTIGKPGDQKTRRYGWNRAVDKKRQKRTDSIPYWPVVLTVFLRVLLSGAGITALIGGIFFAWGLEYARPEWADWNKMGAPSVSLLARIFVGWPTGAFISLMAVLPVALLPTFFFSLLLAVGRHWATRWKQYGFSALLALAFSLLIPLAGAVLFPFALISALLGARRMIRCSIEGGLRPLKPLLIQTVLVYILILTPLLIVFLYNAEPEKKAAAPDAPEVFADYVVRKGDSLSVLYERQWEMAVAAGKPRPSRGRFDHVMSRANQLNSNHTLYIGRIIKLWVFGEPEREGRGMKLPVLPAVDEAGILAGQLQRVQVLKDAGLPDDYVPAALILARAWSDYEAVRPEYDRLVRRGVRPEEGRAQQEALQLLQRLEHVCRQQEGESVDVDAAFRDRGRFVDVLRWTRQQLRSEPQWFIHGRGRDLFWVAQRAYPQVRREIQELELEFCCVSERLGEGVRYDIPSNMQTALSRAASSTDRAVKWLEAARTHPGGLTVRCNQFSNAAETMRKLADGEVDENGYIIFSNMAGKRFSSGFDDWLDALRTTEESPR